MTMELWTSPTPNGWKVSIMMEELIEAGADLPEFTVKTINLGKGEQFTESYRVQNPNQKIPTLITDSGGVMESGAILQYLAETYGSQFLPENKRWQVLQWQEFLDPTAHSSNQGFALDAPIVDFVAGARRGANPDAAFPFDNALDGCSRQALDEHLEATVWQTHAAHHHSDGTYAIEIVGIWIGRLRISLRH